MPWNEPGGDGNNQKDPWTGKNQSSGKNEAEELINRLNEKLGGLFGNGGGGSSGDGNGFPGAAGAGIVGAVLLAIWLFTGFYTVDAGQESLVLRFGAYSQTTGPGLHWHIPYPVETVEMVDVSQNRSAQDSSTMLTNDENIVDVAVTVQYKVSNAHDYQFNVFMADNLKDQAQGTIYQVMRSAIRDIVGRSSMDFILREGREQIAVEAQKLMQQILDDYRAGLEVIKVNLTYAEAPKEVKDAFDDANRAREDANRYKNEADTYAKQVVPEARGQAARLLEEANAYRDQVIAKAEGDASRFTQLVTEYSKAPEVTRERLYLETMETVLGGNTRKVLIDSKNSNNLLYLPVDQGVAAPISPQTAAQIAAPVMNNDRANNSSTGIRPQRGQTTTTTNRETR